MKIFDACGQMCPKPLIIAKKALKDSEIKGEFKLLIDNDTSKENVERFLSDNKVQFSTTSKNGLHTLIISKSGNIENLSNEEEYCPLPSQTKSSHIIAVTSDKMGHGDDNLGDILIKGFINTIKEVEPLPEKIVFYNSGIILTLDNSPVIDSLRELEESGIKILVCGTCADFYEVKDRVSVGIVSNMYDILETLSHASKVVKP